MVSPVGGCLKIVAPSGIFWRKKASWACSFPCEAELLHTQRPVSYTHLDVYKRQAKALADQGAEIAFSYQGEALKKRVEPLAAEIGVTTLVECDVSSDAAMDETFRVLKRCV